MLVKLGQAALGLALLFITGAILSGVPLDYSHFFQTTARSSNLKISSTEWKQTAIQVENRKSKKVSVPHLKALVQRFGALDTTVLGGDYPKVRPLVSLEQFFTGSNGQASMWFNLQPSKEIRELDFWKSIRDRSDVWDVLISLRQFDYPFNYKKGAFKWQGWVHSDVVVIITSKRPKEILSLFHESTKPEFAGDDWSKVGERHEKVFVPPGMKALFFWYD